MISTIFHLKDSNRARSGKETTMGIKHGKGKYKYAYDKCDKKGKREMEKRAGMGNARDRRKRIRSKRSQTDSKFPTTYDREEK